MGSSGLPLAPNLLPLEKERDKSGTFLQTPATVVENMADGRPSFSEEEKCAQD